MARRIFAIVASRILETGNFNQEFIFDSAAPLEPFLDISGFLGLLNLRCPNRWKLNVFRLGGGQIIGLEGDMNKAGREQLLDTLRDKLPDMVLLTQEGNQPLLEQQCCQAGIQLETFEYCGTLATS